MIVRRRCFSFPPRNLQTLLRLLPLICLCRGAAVSSSHIKRVSKRKARKESRLTSLLCLGGRVGEDNAVQMREQLSVVSRVHRRAWKQISFLWAGRKSGNSWLQKGTKAKSDFISWFFLWLHELRTPLYYVSFFAETYSNDLFYRAQYVSCSPSRQPTAANRLSSSKVLR